MRQHGSTRTYSENDPAGGVLRNGGADCARRSEKIPIAGGSETEQIRTAAGGVEVLRIADQKRGKMEQIVGANMRRLIRLTQIIVKGKPHA